MITPLKAWVWCFISTVYQVLIGLAIGATSLSGHLSISRLITLQTSHTKATKANKAKSAMSFCCRDWPDAEWRLVREETKNGQQATHDGPRFFSAEGRDVGLHETRLAYDPATRRLTAAGGSRRDYAANKQEPVVLELVKDNPGLTRNQHEALWAKTDGKVSRGKGRDALDNLAEKGKVHTAPGPRNSTLYWLDDGCGQPDQCLSALATAKAEQ